MIRHRKRFWYTTNTILVWVLPILGGVVQACPEDWFTIAAVNNAANWKAWTTIFLLVSGAVCQVFKQSFIDTLRRRIVQRLLDELHRSVFESLTYDEHRVTLFKYYDFYWPWIVGFPWFVSRLKIKRGHLVAYARSGHIQKDGIPTYPAWDRATVADNLGIAGAAFQKGTDTSVNELKYPTKGCKPSVISTYARLTYVTKEFVLERIESSKLLPTSMAGMVLYVGNKPWGVVVLDSRVQNIESLPAYKNKVAIFMSILTQTLE